MKIRVHSHEGAATLHPRRHQSNTAAMIRMTTMPSFVPLVFPSTYQHVLELRFADVSQESFDRISKTEHDLIAEQLKAGHAMWPMTRNHAQQIVKFLREIKDNVDLLVVHCDAGISRSSAVAIAAAEMYGLDEEQRRLENNRRFNPNEYVYSLIFDEWNR